jgi:4-amino-4-deoxy-L-arabinose transferase-like glycosyltransferase
MGSARPRLGGDAALLIFLALLGLGLRLGWSAWAAPEPAPFSGAEYYHAAARSLSAGDGYAVLFTPEGFRPGGQATAFYPPGYSAFLAPFYLFLGDSVAVGRLANAIAGALLVFPVYGVGRLLAGAGAARLAAGGVAVLPSLLLWTPVLLSETLFTLLFASALWAALEAAGKDGRALLLLAGGFGLLTGLAALVRGPAIVLLPIGIVWWLAAAPGKRAAPAAGAVALAAAFVVLLPWAVRNAIVLDSPVLLSTNLGYNLRVGHAPYATGRYVTRADLWAEPARDFRELELLFNRTGARRALLYAVDNRGRELELAVRKVAGLWRSDSHGLDWVESFGRTPLPAGVRPALSLVVDMSYYLTLALAAAGALALRGRAPCCGFVAAVLIAWTGLHILFFGEPRYHLPLLALLLPLAAAAARTLPARAEALLSR